MPGLEDLLFDVAGCVERFNAGRLEAICAAIECGHKLTLARPRLQHGDWIPWLEKAGLKRSTADQWMKLSALELTAEEVIEQGGIKSAIALARLRNQAPADALRKDLDATEKEISRSKATYYAALTRRKNLLAEIKRTDEMSTGRHLE